MDEQYDAIVLGTGLTECVISGLLSVKGLKVLHMDRNNYYGGDSASLNLNQVWEKSGQAAGSKPPAELGPSRDYNIDMVAKFVSASGKMVRMLAYTKVTKYLEFLLVEGSYMVDKKGKVQKVPATEGEALKSSLMGLFEKRRCAKFFSFVQDYEEDAPSTHKGWDLHNMKMSELYKEYSLDEEAQQFIGHCIAMHLNDEYLQRPAVETVRMAKLYHDSLERYGTSPFIYPLYGLGELPQAFARLSAVFGGTYMLDRPVDSVVFDESGQAVGVQSRGETAKAKIVVGDPSYFFGVEGKVRKTGKVGRCICILDHPVEGTKEAKSCQIILPSKNSGRAFDTYISIANGSFKVCPDNKFVAIVSTQLSGSNAEEELAAGVKLLEPVQAKFYFMSDTYEPVADGSTDRCFISRSYDATSHFETVANDILSIYKRATGEDLKWDALPVMEEETA